MPETGGNDADTRGPDLGGLLENVRRQSFAPGLYVLATPIGNLADLSVRAAHHLAHADHVYCEDTRITRRLIQAIGVARPLKTYHEHNAQERRAEILAALEAGQRVVLVSDAGTPLVSDPGFKLVQAARDAGHEVLAVPGPSAFVAAASVAGLPTDSMLFLGFLGTRSAARKARLRNIAAVPATIVLYESPQRLSAMLADARDVLGDRMAVVTRELTKQYETVVTNRLSDLTAWATTSAPRGEFCILIEGAASEPQPIDDADILERLAPLLRTERVKDAARLLSDELGVSRSRVYSLALSLSSDR
ncbi:MAG: 16S rRNA (cytidine(1402)-2'-O)-methyltransferase [Pseudomonadota bacterium]